MGLLRDQESELPRLQRLVARLQEPTLRRNLPAEEWPTALVAYALHMSEDPATLLGDEGLAVYADFASATPLPGRESALGHLAAFVSRSRGAGWRALLLCAMGEQGCPTLCARATTLAITLAPPVQSGPLAGAEAVVQLLAQDSAPPAMLGALLSLPELRLLPALQPLRQLPLLRLRTLLSQLSGTLNSLSSACLLQLLESHPAHLAEDIAAALARLATHTPLVADIALPLPTWAFESPTPQPLHAWSLPEFFPRILPRLQPHLSAQQLSSLRAAFV